MNRFSDSEIARDLDSPAVSPISFLSGFPGSWPSHRRDLSGRLRPAVMLVVFALASLCLPRAAAADVECGDVISARTELSSTDPVTRQSCDTAFILALTGGGELDLGGYRLACAQPGSTGVLLLGEKNSLRNGTIVGCDIAVSLGGEGSHVAEEVHATGGGLGFLVSSVRNRVAHCSATSTLRGFEAESSRNEFRDNLASRITAGSCFEFHGDANRLDRNIALRCAGHGFLIRGDANVVEDSLATGVGRNGLDIVGGRNKIGNNVVQQAAGDGLRVGGSDGSLRSNTALLSGGVGIRIDGSGHKVARSRSHGNKTGISIAEGGNNVSGNRAAFNENAGIATAAGSRGNKIKGNAALASTDSDLSEGNSDCGNNRWSRNLFGSTDRPACVD